MKQLFFAAVLALSAGSFAANSHISTGTLQYKVTSGDYSPAHLANPGAGTLTVDYVASKVTLQVEDKPACKPGMACPQYIRIFKVELPITAIETDGCGIDHITASHDQRPVDGSLKKITVSDTRNMTCRMLAFPTAEYETKYFDRMGGKEVTNISKMKLQEFSRTETAPILIRFRRDAGFSPKPSTLTVIVDSEGKVVSTVQYYSAGGKVVTSDLAQLSAASLKKVNSQIASISLDAKLVDEQEGRPKCQDAPSSSINLTLPEIW